MLKLDCITNQLKGFFLKKPHKKLDLFMENAELISEDGSFINDYKTDPNRKKNTITAHRHYFISATKW
jgi:hypothetical protein